MIARRTAIAALLLFSAAGANATMINFIDAVYFTSADAVVDGAGFDSDSAGGGAASLPLLSQAAFVDPFTGTALADGIADAGFLGVAADIDTFGAAASAAAAAEFLGTFIASADARYLLTLDLFGDTLALGGDAGTMLAVTVDDGRELLVDLFFQVADGLNVLRTPFSIGTDRTATLALSLIGAADGLDGFAATLASVDFAIVVQRVPEPATILLLVVALFGVVGNTASTRLSRKRIHA